MSTEKEKSNIGPSQTYDTRKSYNQLVYGRYIFIAKIVGLLALVLAALYLILVNIGKSLKVEEKLLSQEQYLALNEKARAQYRVKMQLTLIDDVVKLRKDTVLIIVNDSRYLFPTNKGVFAYPEERAIYTGKLEALELSLKRTLLEMQYPFILTRVVLQDSLKHFDTNRFKRMESAFPIFISSSVRSCYRVKLIEGDSVFIFLPDSICAYFKSLYEVNTSKRLIEKYLGTGSTGEYKYLTFEEFNKLPPESQQEQRRAFMALPDNKKNKVRNLEIPVGGEFGCQPWDEPAGKLFPSFLERKIHELEVSVLSPYYNMATFSLIYPMARVYNKNFITSGTNANSVMLVGLKSGRAPAQYNLNRKDCPKILKLGMFADITDYIKDWDQVKRFPKFPFKAASINNRYYGIPTDILKTDCIEYRRDWLEEPGIIEWFQKKGWIHPVDKRPYIPLTWTYNDFRTICKLITDNDPTHKRRGYVDRPGPMMFMDAYSLFHMAKDHYYKPNPSQATTWLFDKENPLYLNGMKVVHDMCWIDKSVRTGVEVSYSSAQEDFSGGRVGMAYTVSSGIPYNSMMRKYTIFGKERPYGEIVGMTSVPGCEQFPNLNAGDCNMLGFSPNLKPDQLKMAIEWIKGLYYGDFVGNRMYYDVKESKTLGSESILYRNALASVYDMDYKQYGIDFRSVFPAVYLDFYDDLRESQKYIPGPSLEEYGLTEPLTRMVSDQIETMFQKVQMDSLPDYERILNETSNYINTTLLNFKDDNAPEKIKRYYEATEAHYAKTMPEYLPIIKAENQRKKTW